jgi:UDP-N-acetylglucosamine acyltransferase
MPTVHPTAILEGEIKLAEDVIVGPCCVLTGPIVLGSGCRLIGHSYLHGPLRAGADNIVYPFSCLGLAPQHAGFDPETPGRGLVIGTGNTFREHVTVHRAFTDEGPTSIGDRNYFMTSSHAGHDCQIGNDCVLVSGALLGGHVLVQDRVTVGGGTVIHQFCRLGRGAMLGGGLANSVDVPPWFMLTGISLCGSVNLVGMRRNGLDHEQIDTVRWVYRTLYREKRSLQSALAVLRERGDDPLVAEYIDFIEGSKRGIATARPRAVRGAELSTHVPS